ncbi:MAG: hypothetical protein GY943_36115 [Chloroflexi bacterium]|nr:hypothetical protein [Chloroflexota bacterium]
MTDLFMIDLASINLTDGQAFDGMAFGSFVDMLGREVELNKDDATKYVTNTLNAIDATTTPSGEVVGLPIDAGNHDKGDAAGWIVGVELSDDNSIIKFIPKWTKVGMELIGDGLRRFFSPTVNNRDKIILGGALVNWPATTDATGKVLLRPIELSQQIQTFEIGELATITAGEGVGVTTLGDGMGAATLATVSSDETTPAQLELFKNGGNESPDSNSDNGELNIMLEMTQEQLDAKIADAIAASKPQPEVEPTGETIELSQLAELMGINIDTAADTQVDQFKQLADLAQQQAEMKFKNQLAELQRGNRYAELSARVTGGTQEAPRGIPMDADTLKIELMKLTPDQATFWGGLLESVVKGGLNNFSELGHGKKVVQLTAVPDVYTKELARVLKAGATAQEFFDVNGLGNASDYDLTQFEGEES